MDTRTTRRVTRAESRKHERQPRARDARKASTRAWRTPAASTITHATDGPASVHCQHGRPHGHLCPHCLGINSAINPDVHAEIASTSDDGREAGR